MKIIIWVFLAFSSTYSYSQITSEMIREWDSASPGYPFYSSGLIKDCPACETYVIVASKDKPSSELIKSFKNISTLGGKSHQGVVMRRTQLLENINELTALNCKPPGSDLNIAYYINKPLKQCVIMPYQKEDELIPILERMQIYLNDLPKLQRELAGLSQEQADRRLWNELLNVAGQTAPWIPDLARTLLNSIRVTSRSTEVQRQVPKN
jgi:hypothetical protein